MTIFVPGDTCWRTARASRAAFLIDNENYYAALHQALSKAQHSILILGWAFDPRTRLAPDGHEGPDDADEIGHILVNLAGSRPQLDIRLLIWRSTLPMSGSHDFFGRRAEHWFADTPVKFRFDSSAAFGACHHQKVVVIDDRLAFCGGGDIVTNRWDTADHLHDEPRRLLPEHTRYPARHEVTMMVDGEAAQALGELFHQRWRLATGEALLGPHVGLEDPWPAEFSPQIANPEVAIARTLPAWTKGETTDEIRRLTLACIRQARRVIYLENQYFTSLSVAQALAARLAEPDGPEVILILGAHSPSWFDRMVMDRARNPLIRLLLAADAFGRLRVFQPTTLSGDPIIVHSKVSVFDDQVARVGSANLNNRSEGFDTECELALSGATDQARDAIREFRDDLVSHFLAVSSQDFAHMRIAQGSVGKAIDAMNLSGRLAPIIPRAGVIWDDFIGRYQMGDPGGAPRRS